MSRTMHDGFAIALAWPETWCKQAGSWYDHPLYLLGINRRGYYRVGHAAVVLVEDKTGLCRYFDFGRYHAPYRHGRVRCAERDHDLRISVKAVIDPAKKHIENQDEILNEIYYNRSTHGAGIIFGSATRINIKKALSLIRALQEMEFIPYGPFIRQGTNCSRFVSRVILAGKPSLRERVMLEFPLTISPSPMWNLWAISGHIGSFEKEEREFRAEYSKKLDEPIRT